MTNCKRLEQKLNSKNDLIYALDQYDTFGVLHVYELFDGIESIAKNLASKHELSGIYIKNRFSDDKTEHTKLIFGKGAPKELIVLENGIKFLIKIKQHVDVGLFLDHRKAREMIRNESSGKDILNLFAYTGSFSLYASVGGAYSTTSVDLSNTYCEWAMQNFEINQIDATYKDVNESHNTIWCEDVWDFIQLAEEAGESYDIIVLDPPSFSRNKDQVFRVQQDHARLIRRLQNNLLREGGFIFFSTNLKDFRLDSYIRPGAEKLTKETVPEEFLPYRPHQSFVFYN